MPDKTGPEQLVSGEDAGRSAVILSRERFRSGEGVIVDGT
jgi:hypothetical protein